MAGFGRVAFEGEYFNQKIVNVFWYRSTEWLPGQGNPFDDVLAFVDAVLGKLKTAYKACMVGDYTLLRAAGVGYDEHFEVVTSSPLIRMVNEAGTRGGADTQGAADCAILSLRCGEQVQINGSQKSLRNRGYLALGPTSEGDVDNYSHLSAGLSNAIGALGAVADDVITVILPAVGLFPVRIHECWQGKGKDRELLGRTYSDVLGYSVGRVASYRRSRRPEA